MSLGSEGPETEFVDGMEQLDEAVRAMTGMLNNRNRGVVMIGVDGRGEPLGISFGEDDVRRVREAVERSLNHLPKFDVSIGSDGGKEYLRIVKLCVAVKADGYGHNAVLTAQIAEKTGAAFVAVATVEEGIELRDNGIKCVI